MAIPKPLTDFSPLAAIDVQQNDVLFVVDVNDTSQSNAGSTKTLALSALFGSMVDAVLSGVLTFTAAASKLIPGATSFAIRNHADSRNNLLITEAGDTTLHGALTTGGNLDVTGTGIFSGGTTAAAVTSNGAFTGKRFVSTGTVATATAGAHVNAVGITGTDAAGVITCTATGANNGVILTVTYGAGYVLAPSVTVTAASASALQLYVDTSSTTGFSLSTTNNMTNGVTYTFYYQVIQ